MFLYVLVLIVLTMIVAFVGGLSFAIAGHGHRKAWALMVLLEVIAWILITSVMSRLIDNTADSSNPMSGKFLFIIFWFLSFPGILWTTAWLFRRWRERIVSPKGMVLIEAILSNVDLDDPTEQFLAQRFMIEALGRVTAQLPEIAQSAAYIANRFITGVITAEEVIEERTRLWNAIEGRYQSNEPDVLKIRTAICVLHPMDLEIIPDTLEYFFAFWQQSGLGQVELAAAVENKFGSRLA